jgi:hypothetical protein
MVRNFVVLTLVEVIILQLLYGYKYVCMYLCMYVCMFVLHCMYACSIGYAKMYVCVSMYACAAFKFVLMYSCMMKVCMYVCRNE